MINTSMPRARKDCNGTRNNIDRISIVSNRQREINARSGNAFTDKIFVRLIDTPTKINPVNAADAPAFAIKKLFQSFIFTSDNN